MRVLYIDVNCRSGSTGKIVYDLYSALRDNGNESAICYGRGKTIREPEIIKFTPDWEMYIDAVLSRVTGYNGIFSNYATTKLLNYIDQYKPDIVHINDPKTYYMNFYRLIKYLRRNDINTVWTFHSEYMYSGKCGYSYDCEKWKTGCGHCPDLKGYVGSIWFDQTNKMWKMKKEAFDGWNRLVIVSPSEWLGNRVRSSFLHDKDIRVINNGIDTQLFSRKKTDELRKKLGIGDKKVILSVAPDIMSERKGGKWVLKIADRLKSDNSVFILIGCTDDDLKNNGYRNNVILIKRTDNQQELAEYYSLADIFVICSLRENYPTTCLEAQACGTSVCGFDTGGTAETGLIENRFVEFGDIEGLARIIQGISRKTDSGSKSISEIANQKWSKGAFFKNYYSLYSEMINKG